MYEIELKAHVPEPERVAAVLNTFAQYDGKNDKTDTYYHFQLPAGHTSPEGKPYLSCRIRREEHTSDGTVRTGTLFTYKRHELIKNTAGAPIEVNDEKECSLSDPCALETLLADTGYTVLRTKRKITEGWYMQTDAGKAHIELCNVPPLGFFLEIEIMSGSETAQDIAAARKEIEGIFIRCGIPLSLIEPRYYNDMLAEAHA